MEKKVYIEMDDSEFDSLVKETFGIDFCFVADHEANNDNSYKFADINKTQFQEEMQYEYVKNQWDDFINTGKGSFMSGLLLYKLCELGKIEPGDYLINVCW